MLATSRAQVNVDRDRASALGVSQDQVRQALYSAFGSRQISTIYGQANAYPVILEALPEDQRDETGLAKLYLRSSTGRLVPLSAVASIERLSGPLTVGHQGQLPAVTIGFNTAPGVSLGEGVIEHPDHIVVEARFDWPAGQDIPGTLDRAAQERRVRRRPLDRIRQDGRLGYVVVRVTWADLERPGAVAAKVRAALRAAA